MCDYDYDWQTISERIVTRTRKPHECGGCLQTIPVGSRARFVTGRAEGEICHGYSCEACDFAAAEPDHTALHICWGDMWEAGTYDPQTDVHAYLRYCFNNGETPTATGLEAALAQHAAADA